MSGEAFFVLDLFSFFFASRQKRTKRRIKLLNLDDGNEF